MEKVKVSDAAQMEALGHVGKALEEFAEGFLKYIELRMDEKIKAAMAQAKPEESR